MRKENVYLPSLFGGAMAGLFVDISLFPLDTIKTRLQAAQGFIKSGGFHGIYRGIGPQVIGSAPQGAMFFCTYESFKHFSNPYVTPNMLPAVHMMAASLGEMVACVIRVPMEIVKQRRQVSKSRSSLRILLDAYQQEGLRKGLYRGYGSTLMREIPFSIIQFPLYEYFKVLYKTVLKNNESICSYEVAICGALAGGIAAGLTTPVDVIKTRIMLADISIAREGSLGILNVGRCIYKEKGIKGLFAGFTPRVMWITIGGYIFFGVYDFSRSLCNDFLLKKNIV